MFGKTVFSFIIVLSVFCFVMPGTAFSFVTKEGGRSYIVDQRGEKWDVTQVASIGFKSEHFQYGIGRNAFTPLNDSHLSDSTESVSKNLRIIGVADGSQAQAYSVPKLRWHEIANTEIGSKPITVGY